MTPDAERSRAVYGRYLFDGSLERLERLGERDRERYWRRLYYRLGGRNDRMLRMFAGGKHAE